MLNLVSLAFAMSNAAAGFVFLERGAENGLMCSCSLRGRVRDFFVGD
jgi:hypothetical protein